MAAAISLTGARRARRVLWGLSVPSAFVVLILGSTAWHVAGEDARKTSGLVDQMQMLIGVCGLAASAMVALSTIYYAIRNAEMVDTMVRSAIAADQKPEDDAIDRLAEASYGVAASVAGLTSLMAKSWRWWLPGAQRTREHMLLVVTPQVTTQLSEVLKASETLRSLQPHLDQSALDLASTVAELFETALGGDIDAVKSGAADVRRQVLALRAEADRLRQDSPGPGGTRLTWARALRTLTRRPAAPAGNA